MTNFRAVLVPTDFGEPAGRALDVAIELAAKFDAKLTLLHVYQVPTQPYDYVVVLPLEEHARSAQRELDAELAKLKPRYPNCDGLVESGRAAERIVEVAATRGAGIIVMGTHGRRGLPRFLLGSVAERVVRTSPVPVLTVPAEQE
jgi:nucleotide-binding universal stress UspA family protein